MQKRNKYEFMGLIAEAWLGTSVIMLVGVLFFFSVIVPVLTVWAWLSEVVLILLWGLFVTYYRDNKERGYNDSGVVRAENKIFGLVIATAVMVILVMILGLIMRLKAI